MNWQGGDGTPAIYEAGGPELYAGTPEDVRVAVAAITAETKDGLHYDAVPWRKFHHAYGPGDDLPGILTGIGCSDAESADQELLHLWNMICHQGTPSAAGALAVPFLIRIAHSHPRALLLIGALARRPHLGDGTRAGLLRADTPTGVLNVEPSGYLNAWSVEAARQALTADTDLLLPLLDHTDPAVRTAVAYALSAAAAPARDRIKAALYARFDVEEDLVTRASLVLAIGEVAWVERDADTIARTRAWWGDPARPAEVRVSAALAWLCLVDDPIPAELDALFDEEGVDRLAALLVPVPWLFDVDREDGLRSALVQMRNPDDYAWLTTC